MPTVKCPHCAVKLNAPAEYNGRKVKCTNCGKAFVLRFVDRTAATGGSTIDLFEGEELAPSVLEPPTAVKLSITVEPWRAELYQQVTDEQFARDLSAFARAAFDAMVVQLGYPLRPPQK